MASFEELQQERLRKLNLLKERGLFSFASNTARTHTIGQASESFDALVESKEELTLAGRVMAIRGQGAIIFLNIGDGTGTIQGLLKKDETPEEALLSFQELVDIGDHIEATGTLFVTKRGERTLAVTGWGMLTKSMRPLPDKWHGITDPDARYRERYLDLLMNPDLRALFERKARFWRVARTFMEEKGFLSVETPTLEVTTGGAEATPFRTHHHDFDIDVFLRISVGELWQKRLMAGGFPKTFEIGRVWRNEGTSPDHIQEFTNLEFYQAYANYKDGMKLVEEMYVLLAREVYGHTQFTTRGHSFDLSNEWKRIEYVEEVKRQTGIDVLEASEEEMKDALKKLGVVWTGDTRERLMDTLWKYCRKQIAGPAFVIHHPVLVSPLSKVLPRDPRLTERFQIILAGSEVGNGFSELNDPIDQRARFETQQKLMEAGDKEAMQPEWEFVDMLEYGMPPTCGFGFGERLFAFLEDKPIRETQLFPLMRPNPARIDQRNIDKIKDILK